MITYMLDTCICSYIMRQHPASVLQRLTNEVNRGNRIVISAITYAEMRYGQIGKKASAHHKTLVDAFVLRVEVLPWDTDAVDSTVDIMQMLAITGSPIGPNDTAIAGHALATGSTLVTHNVREFSRVPKLVFEDWA